MNSTFEEPMVVEYEVEVSTSPSQKPNSSKKWNENDMKKVDRKTWEKTGARPKANSFIGENSSSTTRNPWYNPFSILR